MKPLALLFGLMLPLSASAVEYRDVVPAQSSIRFVAKQMNVPLEGRFGKFAVRMNLDPAHPERASAQVDIDVASIDAGMKEANDEAKSKNWFAASAYPTARFVSTALKPLGDNRFEVTGNLFIKGRTLTVSAPFVLTPQGKNAVLDGRFIIKRLQFGIGEGEWADTDTVADDVEIRFHLLAQPAR